LWISVDNQTFSVAIFRLIGGFLFPTLCVRSSWSAVANGRLAASTPVHKCGEITLNEV
jgi:hypothetical protein